MDRWVGKIAVVTGASSGIGSAVVKDLVNAGMIVIGLARREDRMEQLKQELHGAKGEFHSHKCDISDLQSVKSAFAHISERFGRVHAIINNAGIVKNCTILDNDNELEIEQVIKTNLMGSIYCIKETYKIMKETGEECHIININSILGHYIPVMPIKYVKYNLYPSSKYALRAASEVLKEELKENKNFRVSNISPGLVKTEISHASGNPDADRIMNISEILLPEDVSKTVLFVLEMPKHAQISEIILNPVGQRF